MPLLPILQSFQNKNDCVFVATTSPRKVISTADIIKTSFNEAIRENKLLAGLLPK